MSETEKYKNIEGLYFTRPQQNQKYHIFDKSQRSLCGRWMMLKINPDDCVPVTGAEKFGKDDCKACFKKAGLIKTGEMKK